MSHVITKDLEFGEANETTVKGYLEEMGWKVDKTTQSSITDYVLTLPDGRISHAELKTRRCASSTYATTIIGENKLDKAKELWGTKQEKTYFLFSFTDGLYMIDPLIHSYSEKELKKFRWDRGGFDKPKPYLHYKTSTLTLIFKKEENGN